MAASGRRSAVSMQMFDDPLDMLPTRTSLSTAPYARFSGGIWKDRIRRRASIFAWISMPMQAGVARSVSTLPVILGNRRFRHRRDHFVTGAIYIIGHDQRIRRPAITRGSGIVALPGGDSVSHSCRGAAAFFLHMGWKGAVPVSAATLMWGHYWTRPT